MSYNKWGWVSAKYDRRRKDNKDYYSADYNRRDRNRDYDHRDHNRRY